MKLKETDDMRAPLAFLLGKLNFSKEFRDIQARPEGDGTLIAAVPATPNLPYTAVEFLVSPDRQIRRVKVTGYDKSVLEFRFDQEVLNPSLDGKAVPLRGPQRRRSGHGGHAIAMPEWVLKYADSRGEIHSQVAQAGSEKELRERYAQQGFLIYSVRPRGALAGHRRRPASASAAAS